MKKLYYLLAACILAFTFQSCEWDYGNQFLGTWTTHYNHVEGTKITDAYITFSFFDDMTCVEIIKALQANGLYNTETKSMKYDYNDKRLSIYNDDVKYLFEYHITGKNMSLYDLNGEETFLFVKEN